MNSPGRYGWFALVVSGVILCAAIVFATKPIVSLPYHDHFSSHSGAEWIPMGGSWQIRDDAIVNESDEQGAKVITGSPEWKDLRVTAEVRPAGNAGDAGIIVRVSDPEPGADAYDGYYIGLRAEDHSLVMGRADYGWMEAKPIPMVGKASPDQWYRLEVIAEACTIAAKVTNLSNSENTYGAISEPNCLTDGQVGLRSMNGGAAWRSVTIERERPGEINELLAHVKGVDRPTIPTFEADYGRPRPPKASEATVITATSRDFGALHDDLPINVVRETVTNASGEVTIRGTVTLRSPLYIQDATGGIQVEGRLPEPVNLGDELRMRGSIEHVNSTVIFRAKSIELTGDRFLVPPAAISSTQAAGITFDGELVELRATLTSKSLTASGDMMLRLSDSTQRYQAVGPVGLSNAQFTHLRDGSEIRTIGILRSNWPLTEPNGAFTVLMRSAQR